MPLSGNLTQRNVSLSQHLHRRALVFPNRVGCVAGHQRQVIGDGNEHDRATGQVTNLSPKTIATTPPRAVAQISHVTPRRRIARHRPGPRSALYDWRDCSATCVSMSDSIEVMGHSLPSSSARIRSASASVRMTVKNGAAKYAAIFLSSYSRHWRR